MSLYSASPTRSYRSADGGLVTEGPGFREYVYESPDGSTSIREKHEATVNREEYEYEEHRRSVSPLGTRGSPHYSTAGSYYNPQPLPPVATYSPSYAAPASPSFQQGYAATSTYSPSRLSGRLSPRDEIHDHLERVRREVDQVRAEAEAEIQRVKLDAELALSRARSRSPPPRSPAFSTLPPEPHLSPSRYSPSYTHRTVSPSYGYAHHSPVYSTSASYHDPIYSTSVSYHPGGSTTETIEEYYHHTETIL